MSFATRTLLAAFSGLLIARAFYPNGFLAWLAFVPYLISTRNQDIKRAAFLSALVGLSSGIFNTFAVLAFSPYALIYFAGLYLAIVFAVGTASHFLCQKLKSFFLRSLVLPLLWVLAVWLSSQSRFIFPCGLAPSQTDFTPLLAVCRITGAYGLEFLLVWANALIYLCLLKERPRGETLAAISLFAAVLTAVLVYGSFAPRTPHNAPRIKVSVVQAGQPHWVYLFENILPDFKNVSEEVHLELTRQAVKEQPNLIIWPEGAIRPTSKNRDRLKTALKNASEEAGALAIAGDYTDDEAGLPRNSALFYSTRGQFKARYNKNFLIPLLEDFKPGDTLSPIPTELGTLGAFICFESVYPKIARSLTRNGAQALVLLTNDALLKKTRMAQIHARHSILRAVENGRYLIRASQSGPSFIIDPWGRVLNKTSWFQRAVLTGNIAMQNDYTIYTKYGELLPLACAIFVALLFVGTIKGRA